MRILRDKKGHFIKGSYQGFGFSKGHKSWNKGKSWANGVKDKISLKKLGKKLTKEHKEKISTNNSHYWLNKKRPQMIGSLNSQWKGGVSRNKHSLGNTEYRKWRSMVFQRDNWICQTCGIRSKSGKPIYLEGHHIKSWAKFPELRFDINNGITLCRECHKLTSNYKNKNA